MLFKSKWQKRYEILKESVKESRDYYERSAKNYPVINNSAQLVLKESYTAQKIAMEDVLKLMDELEKN